jgi:hypothetical protein
MTVKLTLRVPGNLHAQLATAAEADKRSMNGEIEWLLGAALAMREAGTIAPYLEHQLPQLGTERGRRTGLERRRGGRTSQDVSRATDSAG